MQNFHELRVWQHGHQLTLDVYRVTRSFPKEELFGLCSQMRRAAASIPANIAEGSARTPVEFGHFLRISMGSASELEYHLLLARDLTYLPETEYQKLNAQTIAVKQMLTGLIKSVSTRNNKIALKNNG